MSVEAPADVTVVVPFLEGGSEEWLEQALAGFAPGQKLVVVRNDGGLAAALNEAVEAVGTEWVYRFDADDVAAPGLVQRLRDAVWDGSDVAYPTMIIAADNPDGELVPVGVHHADLFCPRRLETHNYISGASLFRRSLFLEVGGYRDLAALEDWDLWRRMALAGGRFKAVPDAWFDYRQHPGSRNRIDAGTAEQLAREIGGDSPAADCEATFYYGGTPFSAHLRCLGPARHLPAVCQPMYCVPFEERDEQPAIRFPHHRGAAVIQFGATQTDAMVARWLQLNDRPVFVEVDDDYTEFVRDRISVRSGWQERVVEDGKALDRQQPSTEGHLRIVRSADGVICSTPYLAERYRRHNVNVHVCPNQVEPDEWPPPRKPSDGVFRVGWFASPSHERDWLMVKKALSWAARQKRVEVVLMGLRPDDAPPHRYVPWCDDWGVYRLALQQLDVGLAPILASRWARGRSDVKALDYAMACACPVLQADVEPYEGWRHGDTCLKAGSPDEWLVRVKQLVYERGRAREIAERARAYALSERTFAGNAWRWREAFASVGAAQTA